MDQSSENLLEFLESSKNLPEDAGIRISFQEPSQNSDKEPKDFDISQSSFPETEISFRETDTPG